MLVLLIQLSGHENQHPLENLIKITNDNDVDHNITINDEDNDVDGMKDNEVGTDGVKIE